MVKKVHFVVMLVHLVFVVVVMMKQLHLFSQLEKLDHSVVANVVK
jgi:hypothetical protein